MNIIKTPIPDLLIIEPKVFGDSRGYFLESYQTDRYRDAGIDANFIQDNEAFSTYGVVRGLHYQLAPYAQAKLVRVVLGRVLDVAVDIRRDSPTFGQAFSIELSAENKKQFYVPRGFAHGYSVLSGEAVFSYKCDNLYHPQGERGISLNDSSLAIDWKIPTSERIISAKDEMWPELAGVEINFRYGK